MHYSDTFTGLGLFVIRNFLDEDLCARLMAEMSDVPSVMGPVAHRTGMIVNEEFRRAKVAKVASVDAECVRQKLLSLRPQLEQYFELPLRILNPPSFLRYDAGDYCHLHIDRNHYESEDDSHLREVSVVVFLNNQVETLQPGKYVGGSLGFYGLIDEPGWRKKGLPCPGEAGLLVAFRSNVLHGVMPIEAGTRGSVVCWFG